MAKISINIQKGETERNTELIIGIDLGTTNSLVAYMNKGEAQAVKDARGRSTLLPSVIHFDPDGQVMVGEEAREKLRTDPAHTIYSVKRLMGKSFGDVKEHQQFFGYQIIDDDTESLVKVRVRERFFTPIELSARILSALKTRIEKQLGHPVSKAVITVPAYFNDSQRQATRDAGKLAGLDVLRIVNEPTAASLAYGLGLGQHEGQTIAVYDLGGGTFDVSILRIEDGVFEVLSTHGDTFLGGDDFDRALVNHWTNTPELEPLKGSQGLRLLAEEAKKQLGNSEQFEGETEGHRFQISRSEFEALIKPLVERSMNSCRQALQDAGLQASDIDHVVLVGGSTRVPLVRQSVANFFGKAPYDKLNPDEVVALGAAIQADILAGNQRDLLLLDVTPLSLGIETVGGLMDVIIPRNSKVPNRIGRQYTTSVDGQRNLKVSVYQGERDLVANNRKLGEFILQGIPPMPAGLPKIDIQFILNADGILRVRAKELRSGLEQEIEVKPAYGISEENMARMLLESIQNAQADMAIRALLEARNEANNILLSADKFVQQNTDILSIEEANRIEALRLELAHACAGEDKDRINRAIEAINEYTKPLAHRAMDKHVGEAMRGQNLDLT
jgi:molecular chaperone HscA